MKPEEKIYKAYFNSQKNNLYFNEIKDLSKLSDSSLARALDKLTKNNILVREKTKSNTFYKIKDKKLFALKFSEIAINRFNKLNLNVKNPLRNFLKNVPKEVYTIILFGSSSKNEEHKESDIDLLVVSENNINMKENKKEAELTSKYPLSLFNATITEFMENKDDVIIQARKTGFPIHKEQNFYEAIMNEYR
ncbi:MAG: nucleotidyltransferase domain-containing protein [Candidatus Nanoarchaeia archaeon]|nr:nucleotidyltransferase domain-containing protein [Candidatus Nanoarchaeia archaeon]